MASTISPTSSLLESPNGMVDDVMIGNDQALACVIDDPGPDLVDFARFAPSGIGPCCRRAAPDFNFGDGRGDLLQNRGKRRQPVRWNGSGRPVVGSVALGN